MSEQLDAALEYADFGWHVFPCTPNDKLPLTEHGFKEATTEVEVIKAWWKKWPTANLGVATGAVSKFFVVDVDVKDGAPGLSSLAELKRQYGDLPTTATTKTWSGGNHFLFDYSPGIRNRAGILPGIDVRGDGGYIVVPPSQVNGHAYEWMREGEIAVPPGWLVNLIVGKRQDGNKSESGIDWEGLRDGVEQGQRNDQLFRYAASLRAKSIPFDEARVRMLERAEKCQPPLDPREALKILEGVYARYLEGPLHLTDYGNSLRLVLRHGGNLRYVPGFGKWFIWEGHRWAEDVDDEVVRRAKDTAIAIYGEAVDAPDDAARKAIVSWATKSEHRERLKAAVALAESELPVILLPKELDANPFLFGVRNGVVDLRTGEFRAGRREDGITKQCNCDFDPVAQCPQWLAFLAKIMNGRQPLIDFLQRALGYSLTGDTREQCLFILYGTGANGKSTAVGVIKEILGEYAKQTDAETWMVRVHAGPRNDIARLRGARFVSTVEVEDGQRLAESLTKHLTGEDTVTARFLYKETFEFKPQFKIFIAANHKPVVKGDDWAIWRRLRLVPFDVKIAESEQDKELQSKLLGEASGILNWLIAGCRAWQASGLGDPDEVKAATSEYRNEMDILTQFFDDCCEFELHAQAVASVLYNAYKTWAEANGVRYMSSNKFGRKLMERGYQKGRDKSSKRYVVYHGIRVLDESER